jgi:hypothetical protein
MSESVFKFFPYNLHDLDALANNYLWFSSYQDFNDPFEDVFIDNALNVDIEGNDITNIIQNQYSKNKAIQFFKKIHSDQPSYKVEKVILDLFLEGKLEQEYIKLMSKTLQYTQNKFREHTKEMRVCCFAQDRSDKLAIENKLMWSHYGNGLRGFCVEYDREKFIEGIYKNLNEKVAYTSIEYTELKKYNIEELLLNSVDNENVSGDNIGIGNLVTMKSLEWKYENEFRLMVKNKSLVSIPSESIRSIIFGEKMDKFKKQTLLSVIRGNKRIECKVKQAIVNAKTFDMNINEMEKVEL